MMRSPTGSIADQWIRSLGAFLIDPTTLTANERPLTNREFSDVFQAASMGRVLGPLLLAVNTGGFLVTDDQHARILDDHAAAMTIAATLEARWPRFKTMLDDAGIDVVVLKGLVTAHVLYPEPWLRQFGDIDLLVRPGDMSRAIQAFEAINDSFEYPPIGETIVAVQKEVTPLDGSGFEIDLHQSIAWGRRWLEITPELIDHAVAIALSCGEAQGLNPTDMVFHSAVTLAQTQPRYSTLFDFAVGVQHGHIEIDRLNHVVNRTGAGLLFREALDVAAEWFPDFEWSLDGLDELNRQARIDGRVGLFLAHRKRLAMVAATQALPLRQRPRALKELLAPSADWRAARDGRSFWKHLRQIPSYVFGDEDDAAGVH